MLQAFVTENSVARVTTSFKAKISDPFEQPTSKVEYFELLTINDLCLLVPVIIYPQHISGCCIYSYTCRTSMARTRRDRRCEFDPSMCSSDT